jgi:hypothetical protein
LMLSPTSALPNASSTRIEIATDRCIEGAC